MFISIFQVVYYTMYLAKYVLTAVLANTMEFTFATDVPVSLNDQYGEFKIEAMYANQSQKVSVSLTRHIAINVAHVG